MEGKELEIRSRIGSSMAIVSVSFTEGGGEKGGALSIDRAAIFARVLPAGQRFTR